MNIENKIYTELDAYNGKNLLNTQEKMLAEGITVIEAYMPLSVSETYVSASPSEKDEICSKLAHKPAIRLNGFELKFNSDRKAFDLTNIRIGEITIVKIQNKPKAHVQFYKRIKSISGSGIKSFLKFTDANTLICNAMELDNLTDVEIEFEDGTKVTPAAYNFVASKTNEVTEWYAYADVTAVNLTPAFIKNWWNYDCPRLIKCSFNENGTTNGWGISFFVFEDTVIETGYDSIEVGKDVSDAEWNKILKGHENSYVASEVHRILDLRSKPAEEKKATAVEMDELWGKIQKVVEEKFNDCATRAAKSLNMETLYDKDYGLDCGWVNYYFTEKDLDNKAKEAKSGGSKHYNSFGTINLKIPFFAQSTTVMSTLGREICKEVKNALGIDLYTTVTLD